MKSYTLKLEHGDYKWEIKCDYSDIKDLHKTLAKLVKAEIGKSCSDITKYLFYWSNFLICIPEYPVFSARYQPAYLKICLLFIKVGSEY